MENHRLYREARTLRDRGMTLREIAHELDVSHALIGNVLGPDPSSARVKTSGRNVFLRLPRGGRTALGQHARALGLINTTGRYPRSGSITMMLDAIARGEVLPERRRTIGTLAVAAGRQSLHRFDLAPWVWDRLPVIATEVGVSDDNPRDRMTRLLGGIITGAVALRWREGVGPHTAPRDYRGGQP